MAEHHAPHDGGVPAEGGSRHGHAAHAHPSLGSYWAVFGVLMVGLVLTVWAATQDFGAMNVAIALLIAAFKATCIVLIFMHVKYASPLVKFLAGAAYFWLLILFVLTGMDYISRLNPVGMTPARLPAATAGQTTPSTAPPAAAGSPTGAH